MLCASCGHAQDAQGVDDIQPGARCGTCLGPLLLGEDYVLLEVLGRGGVGMTYRACRLGQPERSVAIKELSYKRLDTFKTHQLFEREALVLSQLDHEAIPKLLDEFIWGVGKHQAFYLVEEFVQGQTLAREMHTKRYTESEVLNFLEEMLEILMYLHGLRPPIVHRDIKPDNLMRRRENGRLALIDFGAVQDVHAETFGGSTFAGTFGFMAPEQLQGKAGTASDLYALGMMALVMLSRRQPHDMMTRTNTLRWKPFVSASPGLIRLLEDLLEVDYLKRPHDAWAVRQRVRQVRRCPKDALSLMPEPAVAPAVRPLSASSKPESLFGLTVFAVSLGVISFPCFLMAIGLKSAVILASISMLAMILLVPFIPVEETQGTRALPPGEDTTSGE